MEFKKHFIFENNIITISQYTEMNKFYSKNQQTSQIIKYLQTKKFNIAEFN